MITIRTTTEISPATFGMGGGGTANVVPPYKLREVGPGGKSEIRPIVTVKRSKTTAGTVDGNTLYSFAIILRVLPV